MGIILSLLTNKYIIISIILLVLIGGAAFYVTNLKDEVAKLTADNKVLTSDLQVSQASVKTLQASIVDQNTAVDKLKTDSDTRVKAHAVDLAIAKKTADGYKAQAAALLAAKIPQNVSSCNAADALINSEIQNAK